MSAPAFLSRDAPDEVTAPAGSASYQTYVNTDLRSSYRIPDGLLRSTHKSPVADPPVNPIITFINARSGGRAGPSLATALSRAIGYKQVFDLSTVKPQDVLRALYKNLATAESETKRLGFRDPALEDMQRLRILAAGGDGTIAWIMGVVRQLQHEGVITHPPPIAIMPLGTGNDLSRSFGWGPAFERRWITGHEPLYRTLKRIADATPVDLDCWNLTIIVPPPTSQPYVDNKLLPHALQVVSAPANGTPTPPAPATAPSTPPTNPTAPATTTTTTATTTTPDAATAATPTSTAPPGAVAGKQAPPGSTTLKGTFWNYFSIGLDAKTAAGFHHLRETKPYLATGRLANQFWYSICGCTSGWFGCSKPLARKVRLEVQVGGAWQEVPVPDSVRALVLVNLQSYAGGRNIWGKAASGGFKPASFNDGLIEVVGFKSGWATMPVMAGLTHALRLGQGNGVRLRLRSLKPHPVGQLSHAYMQIDGEPWTQWMPTAEPGCGADGDSILVEVSHAGVSSVLISPEATSELPKASGGPQAVELTTTPAPAPSAGS